MVANDGVAARGPLALTGIGITMCALTATAAATTAARLVARHTGWYGWATIPAIWPLLAACLLAGLTLVARPRSGDIAAVVAFVCAAQLTGGGVAASRDWFNVSGGMGIPFDRLTVLLPLTGVVIVASTVACCLALASVKQHAWAAGRVRWRPPYPVFLGLGAATAVGVPMLWALFYGSWQLTTLGQAALTWSLPWGCAVALAAWLDRRQRRAALISVGAGALATVAVILTGFLR